MRKPFKYAVLLFCAIILTHTVGCGAKSFDYQTQGDEMMPGPGVFSGDDGEFTLYKSKAPPADEAAGKATAPSTRETDAGAAVPSTAATESQIPPAYKEFLEFQAWKQEKADFESFQEWKESKEGAVEYQEFLEWKRWQEYRQWQEQQKKSN